ncbi:prostaglandin E synthase 3-like [Petromyzon marinus]|uniref:Prostaglandin E synthase 3-like n=1 Tax=Petromyzon marinus TaxID=7757 RepID=A0AAJ7WWH3_PETMA|nr:prostaglandin E synthase 3-like [Petromyzon marinus]
MSNPEGSRPALTTWYDRKEFVMVDFNVGESRDVNVEFQDYKIIFSCVAGDDNIRYYNEIDLYEKLIHLDCRFKVFDRHIHCTLRKAKGAIDWIRLTKDKEKPPWLSTDFDNWRDWREENDEGMARYVDFQKTLKEITNKNRVVPTMDDLDDDDEDVLSTQASDEFPDLPKLE